MKIANGPHVLTYRPGISMKIVADDTGFDSPFGRFEYDTDPPPDRYVRSSVPPFAVVFDTPTTYYAVYGPDNYSGTYT